MEFLTLSSSQKIFNGKNTSILSCLCTLAMLLLLLWMLLPPIFQFSRGDFIQTYYQTYKIPYSNIKTPDDVGLAVQFINKTSFKPANHTQIQNKFKMNGFYSDSQSNKYINAAKKCSDFPDYFKNNVNGIQITQCFLLPKTQYKFTFDNYIPSTVGLMIIFNCSDFINCKPFSSNLTLNSTTFMNNYFYNFIFSTKVILPDATVSKRIFTIPSTAYSTSNTNTVSINALLTNVNTTVDDSIMPWISTRNYNLLNYYGLSKGVLKNTTNFMNSPPTMSLSAYQYQNTSIKYYKKIDYLLGLIGGTIFLVYFVLSCICSFYNQNITEIQQMNQFLIQLRLSKQQTSGGKNKSQIYPIKMGLISHLFKKYNPFSYYAQYQLLIDQFDISKAIRKLKVAYRNCQRCEQFNQDELKYILSDQKQQIKSQQKNIFEQSHLQEIQIIQNETPNMPSIRDRIQNNRSQRQQNILNQSNQNLNQTNNRQNLDMLIPQNSQVHINMPVSNSESQMQELQIKKEINISNNIETPHLNAEKPQQIQPQQEQILNERNKIKQLSLSLNIPQNIVKTLKQNNKSSIFKTNPIHSHLTQNQNIQQNAYYHELPFNYAPQRVTISKHLLHKIFLFIKNIDFFGLRPNFIYKDYMSCWSIFIIILATLFCIALSLGCTINANNNRINTFYTFQNAQDIQYQIKTGNNFRPFLYLSSSYSYLLLGSPPNVKLRFFTNISGSVSYYQPKSITSISELKIANDDPLIQINPLFCFVMPDDVLIKMGGFQTPFQSYFGVKIQPYCSSTPAQCAAMNTTLSSYITQLFTGMVMQIYLPINSYDPNQDKINFVSYYKNTLRQGTNNFNMISSIQETLYVDKINLIDDTEKRFIGQSPKNISTTITSGQKQQNENTVGVFTDVMYYSCIIRPSGRVINVLRKNNTIQEILGMIGGQWFLVILVVFFLINRCQSVYIRKNIARQAYEGHFIKQNEQDQFWNYQLFPLLKWCNKNRNVYDLLDRKVYEQLNFHEHVKRLSTVHELSVLCQKNVLKNNLSIYHSRLVYFKQLATKRGEIDVKYGEQHSNLNTSQQTQTVSDFLSQIQVRQNLLTSENGIQNEFQSINFDFSNQSIISEMKNIDHKNTKKYKFQEDRINKGEQSSYKKHIIFKIIQYFDAFSHQPSFSYRGKLHIKTILGTFLTFAFISIIILMYFRLIDATVNDRSVSYGYTPRMKEYYFNQPEEITYFNSSNFALAIGFYQKPNTAFLDVSAYLNSSASSVVKISGYRTTNIRVNGVLQAKQQQFSLIPCPKNYFDNFNDPNLNRNFINNLNQGWCIPTNQSFLLSDGSINGNSRSFRIQITNKTTAGANTLWTITRNYVPVVLMTVPVVNSVSKTFNYTIKQIRGYSQTITRALIYNITLSNQKIVFNDPYSISSSQEISTYNYIQNRANQMIYLTFNSTPAKLINITFDIDSYQQVYTVQTKTYLNTFANFGGCLALIFIVFGFVARNFAMFVFRYRVGYDLGMSHRIDVPDQSNFVKANKKLKKRKFNQDKNENTNKQKKKNHEYTEVQLFMVWLYLLVPGLNFILNICREYQFSIVAEINELLLVADNNLSIQNYFKNTIKIKDFINSAFEVGDGDNTPITNIYYKRPLVSRSELQPQHLLKGENSIAYACARHMKMSPQDQMRLNKCKLFGLLSRQYIKQNFRHWRKVQQQLKNENLYEINEQENQSNSQNQKKQHQQTKTQKIQSEHQQNTYKNNQQIIPKSNSAHIFQNQNIQNVDNKI